MSKRCMTKCSGTCTTSARGGIASFAISALDIALWDLRCKIGRSSRCGKMAGGAI